MNSFVPRFFIDSYKEGRGVKAFRLHKDAREWAWMLRDNFDKKRNEGLTKLYKQHGDVLFDVLRNGDIILSVKNYVEGEY